jgi:23S rRNA (guanosine2251-2'-O)-methyltransferase
MESSGTIINPPDCNPDERPSNGLSAAMMKISQAPEFASFGRRARNGRSDIFILTGSLETQIIFFPNYKVERLATMAEQIEGKNPVLEALRANHEIVKIYILKEETGPYQEITGLARQKKIPVTLVDSKALDRMATSRNHQGVIAVAAEWKYAPIGEIFQKASDRNEPPFILMLDGVEDPQNLGSIIRTAEAAGVHGIVIPERRSVGLTAVVSRASSGAIEHIPVARVTNLTKTIEELKKEGLWFTGTDMNAAKAFHESDLKGPIGIVMGGEGSGISRLVKEHCDQLVRIPMWGQINSLNVAVATGIVLYEVRRQRSQQSNKP